MDLTILIGKSLFDAQEFCKLNKIKHRVVREDIHNYVITCDLRFDRVNLEIDEGVVTNAYIG